MALTIGRFLAIVWCFKAIVASQQSAHATVHVLVENRYNSQILRNVTCSGEVVRYIDIKIMTALKKTWFATAPQFLTEFPLPYLAKRSRKSLRKTNTGTFDIQKKTIVRSHRYHRFGYFGGRAIPSSCYYKKHYRINVWKVFTVNISLSDLKYSSLDKNA